MKNMKLGMKMGLGFGALIAITLVLGGMAAWNMRSVGSTATRLDQQYIAETDIANEIQRAALSTMYEM